MPCTRLTSSKATQLMFWYLYARLYDGTVAADYYQSMAVVERRMALPED